MSHFERKSGGDSFKRLRIWGAGVCNCIPLWRRPIQSRWVGGGRSPYTAPKPSCFTSPPKLPQGLVGLEFCPTHLLFTTPPLPPPCCPPGPSVTTWRYGGGRCRGVLSLQNVAAKGAWLASTTCSPGSLWRGMFNSLIPHPSLLLLLLFLHNLTLNLGFTLGNENYFEGFKIMRMRAWFDYTAVETEGIER